MSTPVPEFLLQTIIEEGFKALLTDVSLLDDLLAQYPPMFREEAKGYFKDRTFKVLQNWPLEQLTSPSVVIVNAGTNEDSMSDAMANDMGFLDETEEPSPNFLTAKKGIAENCVYQMFVSSPDARLSILMGILVRAFLVLNDDTLESGGLHRMTINQSDLRFTDEMLPLLQFPRVVTLNCLTYFTVPVTSRIMATLVVTLDPKV